MALPLPPVALEKAPTHGGRPEFTHASYTAVVHNDPSSCQPVPLRSKVFTWSRKTNILLSLGFPHLPHPDQGADLFGVLSKVWKAVDHFCESMVVDGKASIKSAWKGVVLHLHFDSPLDRHSEFLMNEICARPLLWHNPENPSSISSIGLKGPVNRQPVMWHMYEV